MAFQRDERGAAAVEFALVGTMFVATVMFIMTTMLVVYINQALDYATVRASRQILTGATQAQNPPATLATFTQGLCGYLPSPLSCGDVIVNLYVLPKGGSPSGYYAFVKPDMTGLALPALSQAAGQFDLGTRGDYQYLQVVYPITFLPSGISALLGGGARYKGKPAYLAVSTAAFQNERY